MKVSGVHPGMREMPFCLKQINGYDLSLSSRQNEQFVMEVGKQPVIFENPMYAAKDSTSKVGLAVQVRCLSHDLFSAIVVAGSFCVAECRPLTCPPNGRKHSGLHLSFTIHSHEAAPGYSPGNSQSPVSWQRCEA